MLMDIIQDTYVFIVSILLPANGINLVMILMVRENVITLVGVYPSCQMERQLPLVLLTIIMVMEQMQDTYVFIILTLLPTNRINLVMI